jgi:lipopolysaccharide transport system permease protein
VADDKVVISPARGVEQTFVERVRTTVPLVRVWTVRDLRVRYRQSVLRSGWSLLQPLAILFTYGWVLTSVLDVRPEEAPYLTFAWAGIVPFTFFAQSLGLGVGSIQQAGPVISRVYLPREVLPLSVVAGTFVDLAIMTGTLVVVSWVQVGHPTVYLLGLVPVFVVLLLWTTVLTVAAAGITVFRRDLNFAVPLFLRVLFIVTPVMYSAELIAQQSKWLVDLNPLAVVVEGTRDALYRQQWPDPALLGAHFAVAAVLLVVVFAVFRRLEPRMSDFV